MPIPVLLDTDIGTDSDDAYALVLAADESMFRLLGVTTVLGDTEVRARIARKLLHLLGRTDVPVAAGHKTTVDGGSGWWGGWEGAGFLCADEPPLKQYGALDLMEEAILTAGEPVTIIAIGPLTNIAALWRSRPRVRDRIARFVIMGSSTGPILAGLTELPAAFETNLITDREAAQTVFASGVPITLVPGNVTFGCKLYADDFARIEASDSPVAHALTRMTRNFEKAWRPHMTSLGAGEFYADTAGLLHDPLAVMIAAGRFGVIERHCADLSIADDGVRLRLHQAGALTIDVVTTADVAGLSRYVAERCVGPEGRAGIPATQQTVPVLPAPLAVG